MPFFEKSIVRAIKILILRDQVNTIAYGTSKKPYPPFPPFLKKRVLFRKLVKSGWLITQATFALLTRRLGTIPPLQIRPCCNITTRFSFCQEKKVLARIF
jgi:hypothetical protein